MSGADATPPIDDRDVPDDESRESTMSDRLYVHPEPVPPASQLAVLPFLAAIDGYLRESGDVPRLRLTIHRAMSREGDYFLQQVCAYLLESGGDWRGKVGRTFAVDTGIIGAAYGNGQIWRTKSFPDMAALRAALRQDEKTRDPDMVAAVYLAIPFLYRSLAQKSRSC